MMSMPPPLNGTAYFNFIASHDGIGLRPAEGLLSDEELQTLIKHHAPLRWPGVLPRPRGRREQALRGQYSLFDALQGTVDGPDEFGVQRFLCAHAIMLGLEGIPGIYMHSLLGTRNDYERLERTGQQPRHQPAPVGSTRSSGAARGPRQYPRPGLHRASCDLLAMRQRQAAFHPNATQFTLHLGNQLFGFWRQSADRRQSIFCISNISPSRRHCSCATSTSSRRSSGPTSSVARTATSPFMQLEPYRTVWISNLRDHR
jgi:sucrose phosphorylase